MSLVTKYQFAQENSNRLMILTNFYFKLCLPKLKNVRNIVRNIVVYRRYVDDVFVLFKSKDHLLLFAKYMNTRHKNLKFTFDFEQNNSFSFLDVKITRGSDGFSTSVFRKAKFSGVFTNFDSFIFESYKTNLMFTLLFRCFTICSDMQSFHLEVEQLRQIFICNNYSVSLIDQCVKTF